MWFILCRALKQLPAGAGSWKATRRHKKLSLMFIFGTHERKKISLQKLNAAESENPARREQCFHKARANKISLFIAKAAISCVHQFYFQRWSGNKKKSFLFAVSTVVWLFVNISLPTPSPAETNIAKLIMPHAFSAANDLNARPINECYNRNIWRMRTFLHSFHDYFLSHASKAIAQIDSEFHDFTFWQNGFVY